MTDTVIDYTLYIQADPDRVWQALTEPAFTRRYWGVSFETDWAVGAPMDWIERGARTSDPAQVVLDCVADRRLSYTWHTFTPEWAAAVGIDEELRAELARAPRTKVTYEIEPVGDTLARLTIRHEGFTPGGPLIALCAQAWPRLASSLKTLLETGAPLPEPGPDPRPEDPDTPL
ncbi:SRPBCC domain-containing protein [Streptomyces sp. RerS4]|uniref:SRPBCC domain-containing protein n=1 Tax=Streptomyces sp. RerS4 TaxID=2942449 RepID=UPI00201C1C8C|nr:SRPBCC domain-containing protein [Streptomyces sp. RerS4]UQW99763.1 SRPBCC domain-containing protein [Streptomyces sp. RerS4]